MVDSITSRLLNADVNVNIFSTVLDTEIVEYRSAGFFCEIERNGQLFTAQRSWPFGWFNAQKLSSNIDYLIKMSDMCHINMLWELPSLVASRKSYDFNIPYIITPHGVLEPWRLNFKWWKKKPYLMLFQKELFDRVSCFHALSDSEVEGFRKAGYKGEVCVIPNGVNEDILLNRIEVEESDYQEWPEFKNRKVVLFMSRLDPEKGLDVLVPAWKDIAKQQENAILVIAGPDNRGYGVEIKKMAEHLGFDKSIKFIGPVYGERKLSIMRIADIFVLPSYSEGFSMAILEAMGMGLPTLLTPGCNFPEAVSSGGAVETLPTIEDITEKLSYMLGLSDAELKKMSCNARSLIAKDYTWDTIVRKLVTVYKCMIDGKSIPFHPEPWLGDNNL